MNIQDILKLHEKWLNKEVGGKKASFYGKNLSGLNLSYANLECADFRGANLSGVKLTSANLMGADLSGAILEEADLSYAILRFAILAGANLKKANFTCADLTMAGLKNASIEGIKLIAADLTGATLPAYVYQVSDVLINETITYDVINNQVIKGRWDDGNGNHLDSFKDFIDDCYADNAFNDHQYLSILNIVLFFASAKIVAYGKGKGNWGERDTEVLKSYYKVFELLNNTDIGMYE